MKCPYCKKKAKHYKTSRIVDRENWGPIWYCACKPTWNYYDSKNPGWIRRERWYRESAEYSGAKLHLEHAMIKGFEEAEVKKLLYDVQAKLKNLRNAIVKRIKNIGNSKTESKELSEYEKNILRRYEEVFGTQGAPLSQTKTRTKKETS